MGNPLTVFRSLSGRERAKAGILFSWFFLMITTLWLLKPIRQASLLAQLGPTELPYARLGAVVAVALVVLVYSRVVDRLTRLQVASGANVVFAGVLIAFWIALRIGGDALGAQRWFVWAVFILVDIYSTVMVGIFWTYTNDVMTRAEADKLYGPIGLGGILGGIAGGGMVDALVQWIGHVDMLLICVALVVMCAALVWAGEAYLRPPPRRARVAHRARFGPALEGARLVAHSRYLMLIVGIVLAYEFAAATTDFAVSVVLARDFPDQTELARMFGRIGWTVSIVALISQLVIVPVVLPRKRLALLLPPAAMGLAAVGFAFAPIVIMAVVLTASDRGFNYSVQQATKETLYVPLGDSEKYKAKAFIDMFVDRSGKAFSSIALMVMIAIAGVSITSALVIALAAIVCWIACARLLARTYAHTITGELGYRGRSASAMCQPNTGAASTTTRAP
ncbi:MAG TPA: Npt1/Npt2 family nucleotide transporter [Kofleriaceae bacterium]|jgi:AAA family ATP:ADP antiporter|nr:Npt1/Npt2 family nucleotide transporter [Kofleriaceae bacterium]